MRLTDNSLSLKDRSGGLFARNEFKRPDVAKRVSARHRIELPDRHFDLASSEAFQRKTIRKRDRDDVADEAPLLQRCVRRVRGFIGRPLRSLPMLQSDAEALADTLSFQPPVLSALSNPENPD